MKTSISPETAAHGWIDRIEYPFKDHYLQLSNGLNYHYVDQGKGDVLLFVHGTPTWSFLYRNFIKVLSGSCRTIAVDHIGFGLSEKPSTFSGHPRDHAQNLSEFIERKDLSNITLVVHDFGGPIGLGAALQHPKRIKQVVLFNSWLWETQSNEDAQKIDNIVNSFIGRFLYLRMNFSPRILLKKGFSDPGRLPKKIHRHYLNPFPDKTSRLGPYRLAQALVGASDWYQKQWEQLGSLESKPWLIIWGTEDKFLTTEYLNRWTRRLPHAKVYTLKSGHFVPEEQTRAALLAMQNFLKTGRAIES